MLDVLYFSDRHVQARLFDLVERTPDLVVVAVVRQPPGSTPVERREPFRSLEARLGGLVTFVAVADEGSPEGMWRDPMGNLADRLHPEDKAAAYEAAQGYLLIRDGRPIGVVPRGGDAGRSDAWFVQEALAQRDGRIPFPDPAARPRGGAPSERKGGPRPAPQRRRDTPVEPPRAAAPTRREVPAVVSPFSLLGIEPTTPRGEARKVFRQKVALYHPDKVSHLADEFRTLAEARTRALMEAWEQVQASLPD